MTWSTHVLDARSGGPATGVEVTLQRRDGQGEWLDLAHGVTDGDGRLSPVVEASAEGLLVGGVYRIDFDVGTYFAELEQETFYPVVSITFRVTDPAAHHHVPLLLSPFAYTTYRGS